MQKTRKTVIKRFKITKNKKVLCKKSSKNHLKSCKSKKQLSKFKNSRAMLISKSVSKAIIDNIVKL